MKKIYKGTISILLATVMMVSLCIGVLANQLGISTQVQNDFNLCWAACSSVINNYISPSTPKTQTRIVIDALGSYQNTMLGLGSVYTYIFGNIAYGYSSTESYACPSYSTLSSQINSGKPVFGGTNLLHTNGMKSGHAIIICGTGVHSSTSVEYMDPADGIIHSQPYSKMSSSNVNIPQMTGSITNITKH